jgi:hypothetical protein
VSTPDGSGIRAALSCGDPGPVRTSDWRTIFMCRVEILRGGTGAAPALPFGNDTRSLQINSLAALIQINRWLPQAFARLPPSTAPAMLAISRTQAALCSA